MRSAVFVILIFGMFSVVWGIRDQMKEVDYRPEAAMWATIGDLLDHQSTAIALTQDYGSRLQYYGWTTATNWPASGDFYASSLRGNIIAFEKVFPNRVRNNIFFLVTDFDELDKQPELETRLSTYPVYAEGEGYIIYQLREKND